jgi:uncharacterized membrane protein
MLVMNVILAVCFIPIWPIVYFMTRNLIKPKKNIVLGVTLPSEVLADESVQALCRSFIKRHNMLMLPLLPLIFPLFLMPSMGAAMTWAMTWLLILVIAPNAVFAVHRGKLMTLKRENGWQSKAAGLASVGANAAVQRPQKIKWFWFLLPTALSTVPIADGLRAPSESEMTAVYITFAAMSLFFWWFYTLIFRLRAEVVDDNLSLTAALTRARRGQWGRFWIFAVWLNAGLNLTVWAVPDSFTAFMAAILSYTVLIILLGIYTEFSVRFAQQRLTAQNVSEEYLDEDEYWILGLFYHNPNDRHLLVNDRVGMNMSLNMAKTSGKVLMGLALLSLLSLPFVGIWMWTEESVPTKLVLTETELIARHTRDLYVIAFDTIESVELIDKLKISSKINGTNFDNLLKGQFRTAGYGNARLCVRPKDPPFLLIKAGGQTFIFNDGDSDVTLEIYGRLRLDILPRL